MTMVSSADPTLKAILYRANYRGSKEADIIIGGFAKEKVCDLADQELRDFAILLTYDDTVIFSWLDGLPFEKIVLSDSLRQKLCDYRETLGKSL
tara:strand:- start:2865 stop:3146 length:282 start_codon:yes stop_codon:yes gene_type:complete